MHCMVTLAQVQAVPRKL